MPGVSDLASAWGHKDHANQGSRIIYITKKPVQQHTKSTTNEWAFRWGQPVQVDRLVSHPIVLFILDISNNDFVYKIVWRIK